VGEILREGSHYNFPKIHLISHYAEQITKFGALGQFSTDVCEAMHKRFKDAYRCSNKVESTMQILKTYTRDHTFAMKDMTIATWNRIREHGDPTQGAGVQHMAYLKLQGKIDSVSNLADLEHVANLKSATRAFLVRELHTDPDALGLLERGISVYNTLQIPIPKFSGQGFVLHNAKCTEFRGKKRNDWVWVRRHVASDAGQHTLNGCIPGRLNAVFKISGKEGIVYRLAHVTLLQCRSSAVRGVEGMVQVRMLKTGGDVVVRITSIEGMVHLIPLEPGESCLVNNRIDLETWSTIYDS
jgi:hypothetical protein